VSSPSSEHDDAGGASFESIGRSECLDLLAAHTVGRVALVVDGHPEILPVNYALDGDAVLFRTAEGTVLNRAGLTPVAFEVDHIDESTRTGWSVMVKGQADDIGDAIDATSERLRRLTLVTWAPGRRERWFVIRPREITGRRLRVLPQEL
jgi:nitroimidazol reductase NimA-like FMN-containing flavoprotein (pyridoxamine 5'-phosphate oxidase superfamily)